MSLDSLRVEVNFDGTTWTDISAWLETKFGGSTTFGRTSVYSAAQSAALTLTLDNRDGRFTPQTAVYYPNGRDQAPVAHPYYPHVTPRRPIRFGPVVSGVYYPAYNGLIQGWPPSFDGDNPLVVVAASDFLSMLAQIPLLPAITQEIMADAPVGYWPLTEPATATIAEEATGNLPDLLGTSTGSDVVFGVQGPDGSESTTSAVTFNGGGGGVPAPRYLGCEFEQRTFTSGISLECWFQTSESRAFSMPLVETGIRTDTGADNTGFVILDTGVLSGGGPNGAVTGSDNVRDGAWHHAVVTYSAGTSKLYIDGDLIGTDTVTARTLYTDRMAVGAAIDISGFYDGYNGQLAQVALYDTVLSADRIAQHYQAGRSFFGEMVDERIARFLDYAGIPFGSVYGGGRYGIGTYGGGIGADLDVSDIELNGYRQGGKDITSAIQEAVDSEGGGSVFYVTPDGTLRFTGRDYRTPGAPVLTVVAGEDDDGSNFQPAYDDRTIVNRCEAVRATAGSSATVGVATDTTSAALYGEAGDTVTSYAHDGQYVLRTAYERVATQSEPGYRLQKITVDMLTAQNDRWAAVAAVGIGDRIEVTHLPNTAAPRSIIDSLAEGWTVDFSDTRYLVTFDTSPADNPARGVWDDTTYGLWTADTGNTLTSTITSSASSLQVTTSGDPLFTTDPTSYPLDIRINEEEMTVTAAPGGTSPQTLAVTRAVNGTTAAAHTAGAAVDVAVVATWTL